MTTSKCKQGVMWVSMWEIKYAVKQVAQVVQVKWVKLSGVSCLDLFWVTLVWLSCVRQACSSQSQYLSESTKIITSTETAMLSKLRRELCELLFRCTDAIIVIPIDCCDTVAWSWVKKAKKVLHRNKCKDIERVGKETWKRYLQKWIIWFMLWRRGNIKDKSWNDKIMNSKRRKEKLGIDARRPGLLGGWQHSSS